MTTNYFSSSSHTVEEFLSFEGRFPIFEAYWDIYTKHYASVPAEKHEDDFVLRMGLSIASKVSVEETAENAAAIMVACNAYYAEMDTRLNAFSTAVPDSPQILRNKLTIRRNRFPNYNG